MADAVREVDGLYLLDYSSDPSHNRSVFTLAGTPRSLEAGGRSALFDRAIDAIDSANAPREHPRMGAVDVLPFVPLRDATMAQCIELARRVGAAVAERFELPVFLYEEAQAVTSRRRLEDIRRGQFEGLAAKMADPEWTPDFGPGGTSSDRRRGRDRRPSPAHCIQRQSEERPGRHRAR